MLRAGFGKIGDYPIVPTCADALQMPFASAALVNWYAVSAAWWVYGPSLTIIPSFTYGSVIVG